MAGIWSNFVHNVTWRGSCFAHRLIDIDVLMRSNTLVKVRDGSSSLLFYNWSGHGAVVDMFELEDLDCLRGISLHEVFAHGQWDVILLFYFPPAALSIKIPGSSPRFPLYKIA